MRLVSVHHLILWRYSPNPSASPGSPYVWSRYITSFFGDIPQTPAWPTVMWESLPVTDCHLDPMGLDDLAPSLLHTVSFLSTAQHTPVGPTLTVFILPSILVHSLPFVSSLDSPDLTNTSSAGLIAQTACPPTDNPLIFPPVTAVQPVPDPGEP